jgi:putative restriction endonuclease
MPELALPVPSEEESLLLRFEIFSGLEQLSEERGGFLTWQELTSFELHGVHRPLVGQRGIHNPAYFNHTLSIMSSPKGPYDDKVGADGLLQYAFETGNPLGGANRKLRQAMVDQVPIILFERPVENVWIPIIPAYVVDENLAAGHFLVAVGEEFRAVRRAGFEGLEKKYVERIVKQRVHQPVFRARVITAYQGACAVCRLRHRELLDAAHIIADSDPRSSAEVSNGLSLCKIHHAAYDRDFLGIDPDYRVHIRGDLMSETDGPMLRHGLQDMHGTEIAVPKPRSNKPNRDYLAHRFELFQRPSNPNRHGLGASLHALR